VDNLEEHLLYEKNLPKKIKLFVFERDDWKCRRCNGNEGISPHHIFYRSEGGSHHPENLVTLCFDCHRLVHEKKVTVVQIEGEFFFGGLKRRRT
jgi:5-methylcytosine-specific restriction endonuclease McrA